MGKYIEDFRQGDTKTIKINYGAGYNVSGWTFYFVMKKKLEDKNAALLVSHLAGDDSKDDPINGLVHITVPSSETAKLEPDNYFYTVKRSDGGTPEDIRTVLPPIDEYNDRLRVVKALTLI